MKRAAQRGFTLTELMVVVAIIAVLAGLMVGLSPRPYNANAQVIADQVTSTFVFARTRAVSTRRVHMVQIYLDTDGYQNVRIDESPSTGMVVPSTPPTTWFLVENKRIPKSASIHAVLAGAKPSGENPAAGAGLPYTMYFLPDGSATASTIYITDRAPSPRYYRVLIYHTTGSSYAREVW